ncbi:uncharacterized protein LOC112343089 [Selaginella moellendorffii]|uniref:uncharacterized protein LOC112343089 n=1 Tax=Selaginella moellendorffii TaxID=88036 RepID=UPI000D1CE0EC|nr:uncharacterized protein LOC112343089 [Selaginella moellendorffii]|eukprot:XP_024521755.1 uncharacterized protein LOC112343089 [Selaginella moellendorffii]
MCVLDLDFAGRHNYFVNFHLSEFQTLGGDGFVTLDPKKDDIVGSLFMIKLGRNIRDVPQSRCLYVRQECLELYESVLDDEKEGDVTQRLYIGNPGVGKSVTGLQLLFLFAVVGKRTAVYYKEKLAAGVYFLFRDGKFDSVLDLHGASEYFMDSSTMYIHDGSRIPNSDSINARTLLISSPDVKVYKEFSKVSGGSDAFYARLWSKEELMECWSVAYSSTLEWRTVQKHIDVAGPIPRLVFQTPKKFKGVQQAMKSSLLKTENLLSLFSLIGNHDLWSTFSHKLLHLDRGGDSSEGCTKIASNFVKEQLLLRLEKEHWSEMISLRGVGGLADFRGTLMELLMHMTFPKYFVSCERICDLPKRGQKHRHVSNNAANDLLLADGVDDLHVIFYHDFADLQKKIQKCPKKGYAAAYFWPRTKTEAAIDSLYINFKTKRAYPLQATVSEKHPVVWHPVELLLKHLSSNGIFIVGLFFIVSGTNYTTFKPQAWKRKRKVRGAFVDLKTSPNLCQYKVKFELLGDDLQKIHMLRDYVDSIDGNYKAIMESTRDVPEEHVRKRKRDGASSSDITASMPAESDSEYDMELLEGEEDELFDQEAYDDE